jgi:hypothetical protein
MTRVARIAFFPAAALGIVACTTVDDIQQTRAVTSLQFNGSPVAVAECVQRRLGARLRTESAGERYVVYNSVKGQTAEGLSHYAITVGRSGSDSGYAELRVQAPATSGRFGRNRLSPRAMQTYWAPVEECARK